MSWKIKLLVIIISFGLFSCRNHEKGVHPDKMLTSEGTAYSNRDHLIEAEELRNIIGQEGFKVVHFGKPEHYNDGHIEGSINIWRKDIEDPNYPYKGMIASVNQIEHLFSKLGIRNSDTLIVYDNVGSCDASRLWWVLENYDFHNIRILNGGLDAWLQAGGKLVKERTILKESNFELTKNPSMRLYLTKEQLLGKLKDSANPIVMDTRTLEEFSGIRQKDGAVSGGRIPGSISMDWAGCINYDGDRKFKDFETLDNIYSSIIVDQDKEVIVYCHSGTRSSLTTFVLTELLGYKNVKNYDGSWVEWSSFEEYPIIKDSITTIFN